MTGTTKWVRPAATHLIAALVPSAIVYAAFRAPEWACGPLRTDYWALWAAGLGAIGAAIATAAAAIVAVKGTQKAISNERELRNEEYEKALAERKRNAKSSAIVFFAQAYSAAMNVIAWRLMIQNPTFTLARITEAVARFDISSFSRFIDKIEYLDESQATTIGHAYGLLSNLVGQTRGNVDSVRSLGGEFAAEQRAKLGELLDNLESWTTNCFRIIATITEQRDIEAVYDNAKTYVDGLVAIDQAAGKQ